MVIKKVTHLPLEENKKHARPAWEAPGLSNYRSVQYRVVRNDTLRWSRSTGRRETSVHPHAAGEETGSDLAAQLHPERARRRGDASPGRPGGEAGEAAFTARVAAAGKPTTSYPE